MYTINQTTMCLSKSMAADFESGILDIRGAEKFGIEIAWSSGVNATDATIKVQMSATAVNWCDVANTSYTIAVTGAGDKLYDFPIGSGLNYAKIVVAHGSVSGGTLTAIGNTKLPMNGDAPGRALG